METKKLYRIFLILLLIIAVGGGIWYCYESYEAQQIPENGTLVELELELHNEA